MPHSCLGSIKCCCHSELSCDLSMFLVTGRPGWAFLWPFATDQHTKFLLMSVLFAFFFYIWFPGQGTGLTTRQWFPFADNAPRQTHLRRRSHTKNIDSTWRKSRLRERSTLCREVGRKRRWQRRQLWRTACQAASTGLSRRLCDSGSTDDRYPSRWISPGGGFTSGVAWKEPGKWAQQCFW